MSPPVGTPAVTAIVTPVAAHTPPSQMPVSPLASPSHALSNGSFRHNPYASAGSASLGASRSGVSQSVLATATAAAAAAAAQAVGGAFSPGCLSPALPACPPGAMAPPLGRRSEPPSLSASARVMSPQDVLPNQHSIDVLSDGQPSGGRPLTSAALNGPVPISPDGGLVGDPPPGGAPGGASSFAFGQSHNSQRMAPHFPRSGGWFPTGGPGLGASTGGPRSPVGVKSPATIPGWHPGNAPSLGQSVGRLNATLGARSADGAPLSPEDTLRRAANTQSEAPPPALPGAARPTPPGSRVLSPIGGGRPADPPLDYFAPPPGLLGPTELPPGHYPPQALTGAQHHQRHHAGCFMTGPPPMTYGHHPDGFGQHPDVYTQQNAPHRPHPEEPVTCGPGPGAALPPPYGHAPPPPPPHGGVSHHVDPYANGGGQWHRGSASMGRAGGPTPVVPCGGHSSASSSLANTQRQLGFAPATPGGPSYPGPPVGVSPGRAGRDPLDLSTGNLSATPMAEALGASGRWPRGLLGASGRLGGQAAARAAQSGRRPQQRLEVEVRQAGPASAVAPHDALAAALGGAAAVSSADVSGGATPVPQPAAAVETLAAKKQKLVAAVAAATAAAEARGGAAGGSPQRQAAAAGSARGPSGRQSPAPSGGSHPRRSPLPEAAAKGGRAAGRGGPLDSDEEDEETDEVAGSIAFVGQLPASWCRRKALKERFCPFGQVLRVDVLRDRNRRPKFVAFIHFKAPEAAEVAVREMNGVEVQGRSLVVKVRDLPPPGQAATLPSTRQSPPAPQSGTPSALSLATPSGVGGGQSPVPQPGTTPAAAPAASPPGAAVCTAPPSAAETCEAPADFCGTQSEAAAPPAAVAAGPAPPAVAT